MSCSRGGGCWRRLPETGWFCSAPVPWHSALTRTHQPPREHDLSGRESSQQLPRHASNRAACRQMLGLLTPCMLSAACEFQCHAPLPDTGPLLPPRSPRLAADVRHRAPPACTMRSLALRLSRRGEHQMGHQRAAPMLQRSAGKQFPARRGAPGRPTRSRHLLPPHG